jgi:hypothetical protein
MHLRQKCVFSGYKRILFEKNSFITTSIVTDIMEIQEKYQCTRLQYRMDPTINAPYLKLFHIHAFSLLLLFLLLAEGLEVDVLDCLVILEDYLLLRNLVASLIIALKSKTTSITSLY